MPNRSLKYPCIISPASYIAYCVIFEMAAAAVLKYYFAIINHPQNLYALKIKLCVKFRVD